MNYHEIDMALGYTPCMCGVIDGAWHVECVKVTRTPSEKKEAYKKAYENARKHLKREAALLARLTISEAKS